MLKRLFPRLYLFALKKANNTIVRDEMIQKKLRDIIKDQSILDAGCGSQKYKPHCKHLKYISQDFGEYKQAQKKSLSDNTTKDYNYGKIDIVGNVWDIKIDSGSIDNILCTEVFEHIPYPIESLKEFRRILKKDGKLILSFPASSIRHYDPYYFYSGFSDRWLEYMMKKNNFEITCLSQIGDYYSWMFEENFRSFSSANLFGKLFLIPALIYFLFKKPDKESMNSMNQGYICEAKAI